MSTYSSYTLPRQEAFWNPREVLGFHDTEFTCVGWAPSKGRRCHNRIAKCNRASAVRIVDGLATRPPSASGMAPELERIASLSLCVRYHQNQSERMVEQWQSAIRAARRSAPQAAPPQASNRPPPASSNPRLQNWLDTLEAHSNTSGTPTSTTRNIGTQTGSRSTVPTIPQNTDDALVSTLARLQACLEEMTQNHNRMSEQLNRMQERMDRSRRSSTSSSNTAASTTYPTPPSTVISSRRSTSTTSVRSRRSESTSLVNTDDISTLDLAASQAQEASSPRSERAPPTPVLSARSSPSRQSHPRPVIVHQASNLSSIVPTTASFTDTSSATSSSSTCTLTHVRRRQLDENCPICLEVMAADDLNSLVWCKGACGKSVHKECFDCWRDERTRIMRPLTCMFCRQPWQEDCEHDTIELSH